MSVYKVRVNLRAQELYVVKNGEVAETMRCSTGSGVPSDGYDGITPIGNFWITEIYPSSGIVWEKDPTRKPYGRWTLGLNYPRLAIHGTDRPDELGKNTTHGCVRLSNDDIVKLVETGYVKVGELVEIRGD